MLGVYKRPPTANCLPVDLQYVGCRTWRLWVRSVNHVADHVTRSDTVSASDLAEAVYEQEWVPAGARRADFEKFDLLMVGLLLTVAYILQ